jgi:RNA polymerase sigma-70 factor (ECF subfamily)
MSTPSSFQAQEANPCKKEWAMSLMDGPSDLIVRAVKGDHLALGQLLVEHHDWLANRLLAHIPMWLRSEISPDDVIQESYVNVIRSIGQLDTRTIAGLRAWLASIVDNELLDRLRNHQCLKRGHGRLAAHLEEWDAERIDGDRLARDESPSGSERRREAVAAVEMKVSDLPAEQREAVRLHYLGTETIATTANTMRRSPAAVRGLLQRARCALRKTLAAFSRGDREQHDP